LGIANINRQQAKVTTRSRMQQNDSMPNGIMSVAIANVASNALATITIANATPNQLGNIVMTNASTNVTWPSATIA
jgi:hypothetical protein